jgi:phosphatidylglycerophosphate synthase
MTKTTQPCPPPVTRVQTNVLAISERRVLTFLCGAMPRWVTPDHLTGFGMVGSIAIFGGYAASNWGAAWLGLTLLGFFIQWFGDSLDGSLARFRHIERPSYGYFVDHSCDGLTTLLILAGMGLSPYVRLDIALIALAGYLLLSVHAFLCARVVGQLKLTYLAAGPTELRLMLVGLTLAMMVLGSGPGIFGHVSGFDLFVGTVGSILILLFLMHTVGTARDLAKIDHQ